jgi:hypothetical protein
MTTSHECEQNRFFSKTVIPKQINVFSSIFVCFKMIKIVYNIKRAEIKRLNTRLIEVFCLNSSFQRQKHTI